MTMTQTRYILPDPAMQPEFYAGIPTKRLFAWVVDTAVIVTLMVPAVMLTAFTGLFFLPFLYLVVGFAYRVATLSGGSATWGMRMMSMELRDQQGARFDFGQAFLHTLGYSLSWAFAPAQLVSMVLMLTTDRAQGLTDIFMGSVAINRRAL